jgi:hypothetical protein
MEKQGMFILGYYQQRKKFFEKKNEGEKEHGTEKSIRHAFLLGERQPQRRPRRGKYAARRRCQI